MNDNILRVKRDGVEYFTLVATGECAVSVRGLALMCGVSPSTITRILETLLRKSPSKWLKPLVGKDLTLLLEITKNGKPIKPIKADSAVLILQHYAFSGSEAAQETLITTSAIGLTSYIQGVTGWLPEQYQASQIARSTIDRIISEIPDKNRPIHFNKDWQTHACRVTGYHWQGYAMANFIRRSVYNFFGKPCTDRLNQVNPIVDGRHRENYHYEHFVPDVDEALLQCHIDEVGTLLKVSFSEFQFWQLMRNRFGDAIQIELDLS